MIFKNLILFSVCACVGGKAGFKSGAWFLEYFLGFLRNELRYTSVVTSVSDCDVKWVKRLTKIRQGRGKTAITLI